MAVTSEVKSVRVSIKLNDGTTESGKTKTVSQSLGTLDKDNYDADKAMTCVNAISQLLSKSLVTTEKTEVDTLASA